MIAALLFLLVSARQDSAAFQKSSFCEAAGVEDVNEVRQFLTNLQRAVAEDSRNDLTSMIAFPVGYGDPNGPTVLDNQTFNDRYAKVVTPETKEIVSEAKVEDLYCSAAGLAIGQGQLWFGRPPGSSQLKVTNFYLSKYAGAGIETMADTEAVDTFFLKFQRSVARNDRRAVAMMMKYPLHIYDQKQDFEIRKQSEFIEKYDSVLKPNILRALAESKVTDLFARPTGIATKYGVVWFGPPTQGEKWQPMVVAIFSGDTRPF